MPQNAFSFTPFGDASPRWTTGTAAPTSGNYVPGDVVFNTAPTAGGTFCWVNVTAGNPGTWKAIAVQS